MDIFASNVPHRVNHVELRVFLQEKLRACGVLAFDIFKKVGASWAVITVADSSQGEKFLNTYGSRGQERLMLNSLALSFKVSNRIGRPEPLKVLSLHEKESRIRAKQFNQQHTTRSARLSRSNFPIQNLATGVWAYDRLGKLIFEQKFQDVRTGCVTFGKYALMIYLKKSNYSAYDWHCRIDIPYAILEHTIPSFVKGQFGSITLTLKSPPKIYNVVDTENLHLYTGEAAMTSMEQLLHLATLSLCEPNRGPRPPKLQRRCTLDRHVEKNIGLCMVYRLQFPSLQDVQQAWTFMKNFSVPEVHCWNNVVPHGHIGTIENDFSELEQCLVRSDLHFSVQFQIMALVLEGTVTPRKMTDLLPCIVAVAKAYGQRLTALTVRLLGRQIPTPAPQVKSSKFEISNLQALLIEGITDTRSRETQSTRLGKQRRKQDHVVLTYKATVTPTGIILRGPDADTSNRVLRKYAQYTDYFMRVSFADEDGLSVFHDPKASQEEVYARFRKILQDGILLAGRRYEFLGFSHASLRCHQVWFMAPFMQEGVLICAKDVIQDLGDFTNIHCSAKCAARIGQAFSDTMFEVRIPSTATVLETKPDVQRNGRVFSDGCGTMSLELFQLLWRALNPQQRQMKPTVLQIRYRGSKGVLSLDSSLTGEQLHIRNSMTKYVAKADWRELELCGAAYRPLRVYLNHQFIKILEDLGIALPNFISVQNEARNMLERVVKHPLNAANFLHYSHSGIHAKMPRLFELMHYAGLSFQADRFLCEIVEIAAMSTLRDLKYRARIPVEQGYLLYGIMDETNTLKQGEVYVVTEAETESGHRERNILVGERVVVTRAPALHPGDIQVVAAVKVPEDSPLCDLHNCIVFSQQGARDLPSQLGGGDLDGDLFHIIYDQRLVPTFTAEPADYDSVAPQDLGRAVEVNDIVEFFIDFMINDKLGQISNMHKIRADRKESGTFDEDCIQLAKLASDAVDFSKSGVPACISQIRDKGDKIRPDFMAPGHNFTINNLGTTELQELEMEDVDDPDSLSIIDPNRSQFRYYRSEKALGHLYRNIDERRFFDRMKGEFAASQNTRGGESLVQKLERYIDRETQGLQWEHHTTFAEELREHYEFNMIEIMDTLRVHRGKPLTELEVFSGNILGKKERASTRYIREANKEVQERFNRDVDGIISDILKGNGEYTGGDGSEVLPRAIACFKIALVTKGWENQVSVQSWKYVTASVCLEQLWKFQGGRLRPL